MNELHPMPNLGKFVEVSNMKSTSGNDIANQFVLLFERGKVFQSYKSIIAIELNDRTTYIGQDRDYSTTTGKYRNIFLNEDKKTTQSKIDNGTYLLLNV